MMLEERFRSKIGKRIWKKYFQHLSKPEEKPEENISVPRRRRRRRSIDTVIEPEEDIISKAFAEPTSYKEDTQRSIETEKPKKNESGSKKEKPLFPEEDDLFPEPTALPEENKPVQEQKIGSIEDVIEKTPAKNIPRFKGAPPEMYDAGTLFENMGIHGQRKTIYRLLSNMISTKSSIVAGPSGSGKTTAVSYIIELIKIIDPSLLEEYNKMDLKELVENPEKYNGKIICFTELQTAVKGGGDNKDIIKAIFAGEKYRDGDNILNILFGISAVASSNPYWKKYLREDPEFKSRANLIYMNASMDGLKGYRNARNAKRAGTAKKREVSISKEELAAFLVDRMMAEIPKDKVIDPSSAFVDQYIPMTFSANRGIEHYEEQENSCLKWYNNEDRYEINGKTIFILGLRNKYRAERLAREDIIRSIKDTDNITAARDIGWDEEEIVELQKTLDKAEEEVDWQGCWDSYLESLKAANAPPELIAEVINRHVINGKIIVIDPLTGEEVVLAQYPKPEEHTPNPEKTVVTDMQGAFDGYKESQTVEEIFWDKKETEMETALPEKKDVDKDMFPELKPDHKYQFRGNGYDSMEEAACSVLMEKYIEKFKAREGETLHVSEDLEGIIDFRLNGSFIEYHPIALCKLDNGFGDFDSKEDFKVYKKVRESLPEEKRKEYDNDIKEVLTKNYSNGRSLLLEVSESHQGKEFILATSPEEVYNKVIMRFGENYPSKEEFINEFNQVKERVKEENKGE